MIIKFNRQKLNVVCRDRVDQSVLNEIFRYREYRAAEKTIKSAVDPIVDVGGHAGFFSLYCRALNPLVKIYTLEPEANNLKVLRENLADNQVSEVVVEPAALAGQSGRRQLFISPDSHNHTLIPQKGFKGVKVPALALADFFKKYRIEKIALLKLDIEGGEYEALEGLSSVEFKKIGAIILEYHLLPGKSEKSLENLLRQNGFGVQRFPSRFDKKLGFLWAQNH